MTELQAFLRNGGTLDELASKYAIKSKRHPRYPSLVHFKYDQLDSPFHEKIVRESRAIILDEKWGWSCVCRGFDKFANHGEGYAASIDWDTARVQEKVDGSLCLMYWYANEWHVATTGTPDASGDVNGFGVRFSDLFWSTYRKYDSMVWPSDDAVGYTFMFELTSPMNRVVVRHTEPSLTLLGARHAEAGLEISASDAIGLLDIACPIVSEFPLQTMDDVVSSFATMSPLSQEGYVIVDGDWNRIKVKHPGYVALHHAKGGLSPKGMLEIVKSGETSEVILAFPEYAEQFNDIKSRFDNLVTELDDVYDGIKSIQSQKEFALEATKTRLSSAMFAVRANKSPSIKEFVRNYRTENLMSILDLKNIEERGDE